MADLEETMAVVARRVAAHYRISVADAVTNIARALQHAPDLDGVEAIYWFTAGWMAGRGRDANTAFLPSPRDQRRPERKWSPSTRSTFSPKTST